MRSKLKKYLEQMLDICLQNIMQKNRSSLASIVNEMNYFECEKKKNSRKTPVKWVTYAYKGLKKSFITRMIVLKFYIDM